MKSTAVRSTVRVAEDGGFTGIGLDGDVAARLESAGVQLLNLARLDLLKCFVDQSLIVFFR